MKTPICDFARDYVSRRALRLHVPGHGGKGVFEEYDLTEIEGADDLFHASGVIKQSETNAGRIFGMPTYYSTEGSSLCIRAMLRLACVYAVRNGKKPHILAGRNAHRSFFSAAALLGFDVSFIYSKSYLECVVTPDDLLGFIEKNGIPTALYVTTPDYIGNITPLSGLSEICRKYGILLIADCAHGAYLKFDSSLRHPADLGADLCCASAHKTLPVLTGGAYLHASDRFAESDVREALSLFASSSPSYLILQSLDAVNPYLYKGFASDLKRTKKNVYEMKARLSDRGYVFSGDEPLKTVIKPKSYGYTGTSLADILRKNGIECEFADPDHLVMMIPAGVDGSDLSRLENVLSAVPMKKEIKKAPPELDAPKRILGIRDAALAPSTDLPVRECIGKIASGVSVGCPPAVPVVVGGELIDESAVAVMKYYGIKTCRVLKNMPGFNSLG
ncbi:MAG: DegT/DnrJ/EryC1/StrS family aminotransferase [Clostridia bacterium]|nr:DegT/DnrJ/EryC1/StrS family aminotransferase [Clostridia bacterium]